jgi:putative heme-binding domain-containing protein
MRRAGLFLVGMATLLGAAAAPAGEGGLGLRVPPGFEVTEFADSRLANDIYCLTCDPHGRVVVSGPGYIRILVEGDGGRAERALEFADGPKDGAQGLLWEGTSLYVTGDGGLRRYRDADGDGRADGPPELICPVRTGGEHNAHAIRRGPDGWLYVLCGNAAGMNRTYARLPTSPIKDPVGGCVLRFTPDLQSSEVVADGFRNPYDMDFNPDGELFTFESDEEASLALPWYEPTRFYQVLAGGHYGWLSPQRAQFWCLPPYACDVVAPVLEMGRGSPTGVVCYRHTQFPESYRGGFFLLDWTYGRVYFLALQRSGATYTCSRKETFLEAVGDSGFAPTAAAVQPQTGDLFIAIGGRGSRGAVYRVRYPKGLRAVVPGDLAALQPKPRSLDWQPEWQHDLLARASAPDAAERLRALLDIRRHSARWGASALQDVVRANWDHADRSVRRAAAELIAALGPADQEALGRRAQAPVQQATYAQGVCTTAPADALARAARVVRDRAAPAETRLAAVRVIQCALGDLISPNVEGTVWEGYSARAVYLDRSRSAGAVTALREVFPSGEADLDREISRTLAMVKDEAPATLDKVAGRLSATSDPVQDLHYLIVLARLGAPRPADVTTRVAAALLRLDQKLAQRHLSRDVHWPLRVAELYKELARRDPDLNAALLANGEFGRPDHVLFALSPGVDRRRAAELLLARAEKEPDYPWSAAHVELLASLPAERALPVLRQVADRAGLEEAVLPMLARSPEPEDRARFLEGLTAASPATAGLCLAALQKLPPRVDGPTLLALVRALARPREGQEENRLRTEVVGYLRRLTGQDGIGTGEEAWVAWLTRAHPDLATQLSSTPGVDLAAWRRRLAHIDWSASNADRGRSVFARATCFSCHSGAQGFAPDLGGVASRFSRDDLFAKLLQPNREVPPRYRTTLVTTEAGRVYQGLVISEAEDSLLLQTGPSITVRIATREISQRNLTANSLMPSGLLDRLADRDLADLYSYLRSLGPSAQGPSP